MTDWEFFQHQTKEVNWRFLIRCIVVLGITYLLTGWVGVIIVIVLALLIGQINLP